MKIVIISISPHGRDFREALNGYSAFMQCVTRQNSSAYVRRISQWGFTLPSSNPVSFLSGS